MATLKESQALLSEDQVREIFLLLGQCRLTQAEIAARFGVSRSAIECINLGITWRHLMPPNWRATGGVGPRRREKSHWAVLTEERAAQIRKLVREGAYSLKQIAEMFGVSVATVCDIRRGRSWKHLWHNAASAAQQGDQHGL
jgi:predicted XRE-type DNA-binding protein